MRFSAAKEYVVGRLPATMKTFNSAQLRRLASKHLGLRRQLQAVEQKLRAKEAELKNLQQRLDNIPIALYILDLEGTITWANKHLLDMLGLPKKEVVGKHFTKFIPEPQRSEAATRHSIKMQGGEVPPAIHRTILAREGEIYVSSTNTPLIDENGRTTGTFTCLYNTTGYQKANQSWTRKQVLESLAQLAGGFAHEFNNLIMAIQAAAQRIEPFIENEELIFGKTTQSSNALKAIQTILSSCERGSGLIRSVRLFSRHVLFSIINPIDPELVIRSIIEELRENHESHDIEIDFHLSQTPKIMSDPNQINILINNLCNNAADFMPNGGRIIVSLKKVTLTSQLETESGTMLGPNPEQGELQKDYVEISVKDNGPGISPENRARIFEPFFSTNHRTGLGLSETLGLVDTLRGGIILESVLNEGTEVRVLIPVAEIEQQVSVAN